ncbi:hypothetical protein [Noviherbaspirillum sp. ST9]|uniref:hypothetical protein n=1 Tax=Noviherbaspirillum sp. ST9 TaxID=3401606 RepID=UPI003B58983D
MKKLPILVGTMAGALIGLFTSIPDDVGLKIVMISIGALAGVAVGGAIAGIGQKGIALKSDDDALAGLGVTPEDLARNYWRDKGRPPLTSPLEPEHGHHQFDPDKL